MQSAYQVLGLPGNATPQDIEDALQRARAFYTREKMAADSRVAERFAEVLNAHKILRDPSSRAAHDRQLQARLQAQPAPTHSPRAGNAAPARRGVPVLIVLGVMATLVFGGGWWMQNKRETAKAMLAAQQAQAARAEALALAERERKEAEEARDRARRDAMAMQQEQALRRESEVAMNRLQAAQQRQIAQDAQRAEQERREERREAQRKEYERQAEDRRLNAESQRRVAADRARIRELCWQNYRKPDC